MKARFVSPLCTMLFIAVSVPERLVSTSDLLGPPQVWSGGNFTCPGAHATYFLEQPEHTYSSTCPRDIAVFLRSATMQDPIGVLKAHAKFQVEGRDSPGPVAAQRPATT